MLDGHEAWVNSVAGSTLPRELEELLMSMLAKRPEDRPGIEEVEEVLRMVEGTLSGRRARGRDARFLKDRQARMVSVARPVESTVDFPDEASEGDQRILLGVVGHLHFELRLALSSNGVSLVEEGDERPADAVLVVDGTPELVSERAESGTPVLATCAGDDMEALSALARAGAADILTYPLAIDELMRKLQRALRRARRRD